MCHGPTGINTIYDQACFLQLCHVRVWGCQHEVYHWMSGLLMFIEIQQVVLITAKLAKGKRVYVSFSLGLGLGLFL